MSRKRHPYTKRIKLVKTGSGTEYINDEPVKPNQAIVLTSIIAQNSTHDTNKIRLGKRTGGYFQPWKEDKTVTAGTLVVENWEHWLRTAEYFQAEFEGGQAGDECWVYLDGYWFKWANGEE